jgi:pimeloyl-ACP methyl ester carboxylesterase
MLLDAQLEARLGPVPGTLATDDGACLFYQTFGHRRRPAVVLANGIGVRYVGLTRQLAALRRRFHLVTWDYRGMGRSAVPDPATADVTMARHARDALTLLDGLGIRRAAFIGWSMGAQVALEVIRAAPGRVTGLVSLLGTCGRPFQRAFPPRVAAAVEDAFDRMRRHPRLVQAPFHVAIALPGFAHFVLRHVPFLSAETDPQIFDAIVRSVAGIEKSYYGRCMLELARHDAADVLAHISCPSLIIAGERDYLMPVREARKMAGRIPGAEYREVPGGTHFSLFEQPERVNAWLEAFLSRGSAD